MEFQKNQFIKNRTTKIAGNKVLPQNNPFEVSKRFLNQKANPIEVRPMTPERRFEEQQNQRHFMNSNSFHK